MRDSGDDGGTRGGGVDGDGGGGVGVGGDGDGVGGGVDG